jgi:hypothetical protein
MYFFGLCAHDANEARVNAACGVETGAIGRRRTELGGDYGLPKAVAGGVNIDAPVWRIASDQFPPAPTTVPTSAPFSTP